MITGLTFFSDFLGGKTINVGLVMAGCISNTATNYEFYLMEMRYKSPSQFNLPPSSCAECRFCGIDSFTKIPNCTNLIIRVAYFSKSQASLGLKPRHLLRQQFISA